MRKIVLLLLLIVLVAAPFALKPYGIYLLSLWVVMTIAAIGLNLTLGYAGQISLAQGSFVGIGAYVVVSSLNVADVRCEVCVSFGGREACRSVEAATEEEARAGAHSNACALISSGVTDTLACQRTNPSMSRCVRP